MKSYILLFLISIPYFSEGAISKSVTCPLTWREYSGQTSGLISVGNAEFVARVQIEDEVWLSGRFNKEKNLAIVPGGEIEYNNFEIMTNEKGCLLQWGSFKPEVDLLPKNAVAVSSGFYVGSGSVNSTIFGGVYKISDGKLTVGFDGGISEADKYIYLLTSSYPLMEIKLRDFNFPKVDVKRLMAQNATYQLLGMDEFESSEEEIQIVETLTHSQTFEETFEIFEEEHNWEGLSHLNLNLNMWFGSPLIVGDFSIRGGDTGLRSKRVRELVSNKKITSSNATRFQVCTFALVVDEARVPFRGVGEFSSSRRSGADLREMVAASGRKVIECYSNEDDNESCLVQVYGVVRGKYAVKLKTFLKGLNNMEEEDGDQLCDHIVGKKMKDVNLSEYY